MLRECGGSGADVVERSDRLDKLKGEPERGRDGRVRLPTQDAGRATSDARRGKRRKRPVPSFLNCISRGWRCIARVHDSTHRASFRGDWTGKSRGRQGIRGEMGPPDGACWGDGWSSPALMAQGRACVGSSILGVWSLRPEYSPTSRPHPARFASPRFFVATGNLLGIFNREELEP